jgi:hypothetical protein
MTLTTEEGGDLARVTAQELEAALVGDAFGKFAVLTDADGAFVQAGNAWEPGAECERFLKRHDSDPWVLEYREAENCIQYRVVGWVTLANVLTAFRAYLAGNPNWHAEYEWEELETDD